MRDGTAAARGARAGGGLGLGAAVLSTRVNLDARTGGVRAASVVAVSPAAAATSSACRAHMTRLKIRLLASCICLRSKCE